MDDFEIFTWVAVLVFVLLGIGFPNRDGFGMKQDSASEIDTLGLGEEEFIPERIPEWRS
jgi:hypothetical protein